MPALANYIHRWSFGGGKWRAFIAAALSLAVRGMIRFNDSEKKTLTLETAGHQRDYRPVWYSGHGRSGGDFSCAVSSSVAGHERRADQPGAVTVRFFRLFVPGWRRW